MSALLRKEYFSICERTMLDTLFNAITIEITRSVTGKLFTEEQIRTVTTSAIGKYFSDFFPEATDERAARARVEEARLHIQKASSIIAEMQEELSNQTVQLDKLLLEIQEKKKLAEKYSNLAETSRTQFAPLKVELEESLRKELILQAEKGRRLRQVGSAVIWCVTLVLGAWLGTYFKEVTAWIIAHMS